MKPVLTDSELHLAIPTLKAWKIENDHLVKHFRFAPLSPMVRAMAAYTNEELYAPCPCGSGKKYKKCHGAS